MWQVRRAGEQSADRGFSDRDIRCGETIDLGDYAVKMDLAGSTVLARERTRFAVSKDGNGLELKEGNVFVDSRSTAKPFELVCDSRRTTVDKAVLAADVSAGDVTWQVSAGEVRVQLASGDVTLHEGEGIVESRSTLRTIRLTAEERPFPRWPQPLLEEFEKRGRDEHKP
jgi:hypothetical protein